MEYLTEEELPNRFMDMTSHQTASDAVRLGVLSRYGGETWHEKEMGGADTAFFFFLVFFFFLFLFFFVFFLLFLFFFLLLLPPIRKQQQ